MPKLIFFWVIMLTLFSPAKVNLFLRITGSRSDGYHNLASLFQTISLGDLLYLALSDKDELTCNDLSIPTDASNLILKAVDLFRRKTGFCCNVKVYLDKKIPLQAGLGGGSSNAATVLWGLNALTGAQFSTKKLQEWSAEIGSDLPFFFSEGTAFCTGRGEIVQNLPKINYPPMTVVKPKMGLSTPAVFSRFRTIGLIKRKMRDDEEIQNALLGKLSFYNDLEPAAFQELPDLVYIKEKLLKTGFQEVILTGSGSALVCFGEPHTHPFLEDFFIEKVEPLNRSANCWYTCVRK